MTDTRTAADNAIVVDYIDAVADRLSSEARMASKAAKRLALASIALSVLLWLVPPLRFWQGHGPNEDAARVDRAAQTWLERDLGDDRGWWVERTSHGADHLVYDILSADESVAVDPAETSPDEFIDGLQYVMEDKGPDADRPGWRYWRNQLDKAMQTEGEDGRAARLTVGRHFIESVAGD